MTFPLSSYWWRRWLSRPNHWLTHSSDGASLYPRDSDNIIIIITIIINRKPVGSLISVFFGFTKSRVPQLTRGALSHFHNIIDDCVWAASVKPGERGRCWAWRRGSCPGRSPARCFFLPHCAHDKIVKNVKIDQIVKIIKISPNFSCWYDLMVVDS